MLIINSEHEATKKIKINEKSASWTLGAGLMYMELDEDSSPAAMRASSPLHNVWSHTHRDAHFEPNVLCWQPISSYSSLQPFCTVLLSENIYWSIFFLETVWHSIYVWSYLSAFECIVCMYLCMLSCMSVFTSLYMCRYFSGVLCYTRVPRRLKSKANCTIIPPTAIWLEMLAHDWERRYTSERDGNANAKVVWGVWNAFQKLRSGWS